jgi:hypothetical protein
MITDFRSQISDPENPAGHGMKDMIGMTSAE